MFYFTSGFVLLSPSPYFPVWLVLLALAPGTSVFHLPYSFIGRLRFFFSVLQSVTSTSDVGLRTHVLTASFLCRKHGDWPPHLRDAPNSLITQTIHFDRKPSIFSWTPYLGSELALRPCELLLQCRCRRGCSQKVKARRCPRGIRPVHRHLP